MSYDDMDHCSWVEANIAGLKTRVTPSDRRKHKEDGSGICGAPDELNPFQRQVITILGVIGSGIYNAPIEWRSIYWRSRCVSVLWRGELATIDSDKLTTLVFLAHAASVRISISPKMRHLELTFHAREPKNSGDFWHNNHPSPLEAFERLSERFPASHRIRRREGKPTRDHAKTGGHSNG